MDRLGKKFLTRELSPRESPLVFETTKRILLEHRELERGRAWIVGVVKDETAGKRIYEAKKEEVFLTIDGGLEDVDGN